MAEKKYRAIGYVLASRAEDIQSQKMILRRVCREKSILPAYIIEEVLEPGTSPQQLSQLSTLMQEYEADTLVVSELSRQFGDESLMDLYLQIYPLLSSYRILLMDDVHHIIRSNAKMDQDTFLARVFRGIGAITQKWSGQNKRIAAKADLIAKYPLASMDRHSIFGFKKIDNPQFIGILQGVPKSILVVDDEQMSIVRQMYDWALEGVSMAQIAVRLQEMGLKSPMGYDKDHKSPKGFSITKQFVSRILHNPLYKGIRVWQGQEYFTGEEYVKAKTWKRVQTVLKKARLSKGNTPKLDNPLKNIAVCPCGSSLYLAHHEQGYGYQCVTRQKHLDVGERKPCGFFGIKKHLLISIVWYDYYQTVPVSTPEKSTTLQQLSDQLAAFENEREARNHIVAELSSELEKGENPKNSERARKIIESHEYALPLLEKKIERLSARIERLRAKVHEKELNQIKPKEMISLFRRDLRRIQYVSTVGKQGFVVIDYKSGLRRLYLYEYRNRAPFLYALSEGYSYDDVTKSVKDESGQHYTPADLLANPWPELPVYWRTK